MLLYDAYEDNLRGVGIEGGGGEKKCFLLLLQYHTLLKSVSTVTYLGTPNILLGVYS